jgi:RNA polymerase sigma-70 factor (ECF subfamily)
MVDMDQEKAWVELSRNGDHAAFEELVRAHQRMIHSLAYRMTGSLDEADDLVQEAFIHAHQHLDGFRSDARFSSWLYRIAMNLCLNWKGRESHRVRAYDRWDPPGTADQGVDADVQQRVRAALQKLSPEQRAAIVLTVSDGMNHAEAARILECSETTVSWRIFTARRKLKSWLKTNNA